MLQPLYLYISKVDRVLHLSSPTVCCIESLGAGRHTNEGWAMDAGRGSCVRQAQVRELCTGGRFLQSRMGAGRRRLRMSRLGAGAQAHSDVGLAGALSCYAGATDVILFRFT
jgi:hypothetical protein